MEEGNVSNLIHNEQIKLTATFANNLAVGAFFGAIFIPIASKISTNEIDLVHGLIYVWGCLALSTALSLLARWTLRGLRE
jgi:hypothetical protein